MAEWFFEVWNEPNLKAFWTGTQKDYFKLYRVTADAIKTIDPSLKVGGPATARDGWIDDFLAFCDAVKVPVDFVTTHHYPTDALGHEDDDTETQLANSQRGVLREWTQDTRRRAGTRPVYYTEWNSSSNPRDPRHDEPYAAAFVAKTALEASDLVQGYSFWTFSDIFEENYFPSVPFHGGFGLLTLQGIAKPAYRAFELLHKLGHERLLVDGVHDTVNAWVTRENARVTVLLVNHALPRHPIMNQRVRVHLAHAPEPSGAWVERIDEHHANAKRRWQALGAPEYLAGTDPRTAARGVALDAAGVSVESARRPDRVRHRTASARRRLPHAWSARHHERPETHCPASRPSGRTRGPRPPARDPPTKHLPLFLGGNESRRTD